MRKGLTLFLGGGFWFKNQIAFLYEPMVKLPRGVNASGAACLPYLFISFRFLLLLVKLHLHGAFHVFAELSTLVLDKTFKRHPSSVATLNSKLNKPIHFRDKPLIQNWLCLRFGYRSVMLGAVYSPLI